MLSEPDGLGPDAVFAALGDPTRRDLLDRLSAGPQTATELAPAYAMSRQAVVKHLGHLAAAGLVTPTRSGREVRYEVVPDGLDPAAAWMAAVGRRWDERLAALDRHLRAAPTAANEPPPSQETP